MSEFMEGDVVRVPGLKGKHILGHSNELPEDFWLSPAEAVVSRLLPSPEGRVLQMGLPYGKRRSRIGVLVEFKYARARRLPRDIGDGYYTDESGERIYDEVTVEAIVSSSMLHPSAEEAVLRYHLQKELR